MQRTPYTALMAMLVATLTFAYDLVYKTAAEG